MAKTDQPALPLATAAAWPARAERVGRVGSVGHSVPAHLASIDGRNRDCMASILRHEGLPGGARHPVTHDGVGWQRAG